MIMDLQRLLNKPQINTLDNVGGAKGSYDDVEPIRHPGHWNLAASLLPERALDALLMATMM